jgi:hypothetical protein
MKSSGEYEVERILQGLEKEPDEVVGMVHGWVSAKLGNPRTVNPYKGHLVWEGAWDRGWERYHNGFPALGEN